MRRLQSMAEDPQRLLPPLEIPDDGTHRALEGSAEQGVGPTRGVVRSRLERQLHRLPDVLEQVQNRAAARTQARDDENELAARLEQAGDTYERLANVLTHGVTAEPAVVQDIMARHRARLGDLARMSRGHRVSGLRSRPEALQMVVDHTHELDEVDAVLRSQTATDRESRDSGLGRLLRRLRGRTDESSEAAQHPGVVAGQLLDRLEAMREDADRVSVSLVVQAGEEMALRRDEDVWAATDPLTDLITAETLAEAGGPARSARTRRRGRHRRTV